jgi:hypothetical protein
MKSHTTVVIEVETSIAVIGKKVTSNSLKAKIVDKIKNLNCIIIIFESKQLNPLQMTILMTERKLGRL